MRILVATDGSASARTAVDVVADTAWPAGSTIRIVTVVPGRPTVLGLEWSALGEPRDEPEVGGIRPADIVRAARDSMAGRREVDVVLLEGRPASAIVDEAREADADLIVVGSRGHGPWQSMLLGSVSAEVVDHAPCPVLVVRGPQLAPIVLATDGSDDARRAEAFLERWPRDRGTRVRVVTAAQTAPPIEAGLPVGLSDEVMASYQRGVDDARRQVREIADAAALRLVQAGLDATGEARDGDPSHVIVEAARAAGAGLIVMGTRGHGGLTRMVLGSVARNVLLHARCSVLVVRPTPRRVTRADASRRQVAVG
jgi:nucleotide-binding universal stress UspA family protein